MSAGRRIEAEALIVGYAMSRLGKAYLETFGHPTWRAAYEQASQVLKVPPTSFKNLRDEFDPYVSSTRRGWHARPMRQNRQAVLEELCEVGEQALLELVRRSLARDLKSIDEVIDLVLEPPKRVHNVAERLLTGRMAEEYFLATSQEIVDVPSEMVRDVRQLACGYDFGVALQPDIAIEVKGLKGESGGILFTDREWTEANVRRVNYWVVIVGNLATMPRARVFKDPLANLDAKCDYVKTATAVWRVHAQV